MVSIMECGTLQSQQQQPNQRSTTGPRTGGSGSGSGGGSLELPDDSDIASVDSVRVKSPTSPTTGSIEAFTSPPTSPLSQEALSQEAPLASATSTIAVAGNNGGNSDKSIKSAVSQRSIELQMSSQQKATDTELAKRALKLDLVKTNKSIEEFNVKSPKSPLASSVRSGRLHHKSLTAQVDLVEDRKTLRDTLYQGIFHRHRRTIFAVGSFLRMLRSRNSQYNTIRSSSEGEDIDETR